MLQFHSPRRVAWVQVMLATPQLIAEALQPERLAEVLPRCLSEVPLYQRPGAASLCPIDSTLAVEGLRRLPFITKEDIRRDFPRNFLGERADLDTLLDQETIELEHTSGTSEERTALLLPRHWWADQEARALRLNQYVARLLAENPQARRVTLSSPVCSSDICYTSVPARADRIIGHTLFLSLSRYPFLWNESDLERMAAEATEWQPQFLDVDPVYGAVFARYCESHGVRLPSLKFILSSYEFLSVNHRRILQRAFNVPVFDLYGSTETGHLLMEDEHGQMQPSLETAFLEVIDRDEGGIGELVVTTLTNQFMPLIRYRIGDLVERREEPYGTRYILHGRAGDAFSTAHGRRLTIRQIDQCFAALPGVIHYQLIQRSDQCQLRFVPENPGPSADQLAQLQQQLTGLLELAAPVSLQPTDLLVSEGSGKFRLGYPASK